MFSPLPTDQICSTEAARGVPRGRMMLGSPAGRPRTSEDHEAKTQQVMDFTVDLSLGLLAHLRFEDGWGGCQGGLTTAPEDMVGALGYVDVGERRGR